MKWQVNVEVLSCCMSMRNLESLNRSGKRMQWNKSCFGEFFPPFEITSQPSCHRESSFGVRHVACNYDSVVSTRCAKPHWWKTWGPVLPTWMPLTLLVCRESYFICDLNFCLDGEISRASPSWLACWTAWCHNELFTSAAFIELWASSGLGWGHLSTYVCACLAHAQCLRKMCPINTW